MNTKDEPWSSFKLRVNTRCSTDVVYRAWATPGGLESWFLRRAVLRDAAGNVRTKNDFIQKDDSYEWMWYGYSDEVIEKGVVLEANGKDGFSFTFSLKCPVTIRIYEEFGETIVELVESKLPTDESTRLRHYIGDSRGWIFYLTNLKSVLEGGLDLRNRKEELTNVITS